MRISEIPPASGEDSIDEEDIRLLDAYGELESEKLTLVGLGPPRSRPKRSRPTRQPAVIQQSEQLAQSEPPGPWGSHAAEEDDNIPPSLRRSKLGIWAVAIPMFVVLAGVTVIALRGLNPGAERRATANLALPAATVDNAGLLVRVSAKNLRVSVDGQDRGPAPMLITGLAPGSHSLTISGPGYETFEQPVLLVQDQVSTIEPMLTPASTRESEPSPIALEDLEPAPNAKSGAAANAAAPPAVPATKPLAVVLAENLAADKVTAPATAPLPANPYENGKLNISSDPPAALVVDGRPIGKAPRTVDVPPGLHTVVFIHPTEGRRSVTVNVLPRRETSASVEF
jgi:hypothetical protein